MANKGQQRGNREVRKPKQAKATAPQTVNPFAAVNKGGATTGNTGNTGGKGKG
ncbi:hypothetical protein ANOBCDAF_03997 [Pleomorphomonas sp. T1.2MG-36]|uniref:hypothetical protein n=1 Tax=Pleomorphomonas sp. T1.2MG-36 TaxID=3041167 RepID=UPI002477AEDD|nr:hypothetical protein [Pleomorphomonas sp. T1.2MG-36]CAI9417507.1 hypothetical protein ANOBCDAF_03997 [Pleomorphomonas sp. T1.2MG-36]